MFKTIVVGNDGSKHGEHAMSEARLLAEENNARLIVVHVTEMIIGKAVITPVAADEDEICARIRSGVAEMQDAGLSAEFARYTAELERPAHHLANVAEQEGADLIVVGSRGHSTLTQILVGSVPLRLLHISPCPLLTVPLPRS